MVENDEGCDGGGGQRAARQIVGTAVAGWLYFTETGEFWRVKVDNDEIIRRVTESVKALVE